MVVGASVGSAVESVAGDKAGEFIGGGIGSALAGGKFLTGGISSVGSSQLGSAVSNLIEDKKVANIVDNAVTFGTAPIIEAVGIRAIAGATAVVFPEIAIPVLALTSLGVIKGGIENLTKKINKLI